MWWVLIIVNKNSKLDLLELQASKRYNMSHVAYDLQLSDAMNDLQEQVKVEHAPTEKNEHGVENMELWGLEERFSHFAVLYIKYIEIYRRLEECYDQMVHP